MVKGRRSVRFAPTTAGSGGGKNARQQQQSRRWRSRSSGSLSAVPNGVGLLRRAGGIARNRTGQTKSRRASRLAAAAVAASPRRAETPRDLARARLGKTLRSGSRARGPGTSAAVALPSALRVSAAGANTEEAALNSLCAAFGGARLRSHECRIDRPTGFVRSLQTLMPLPAGTDYTLTLYNCCIAAESVVTATVLPVPTPLMRQSGIQSNGKLVIASTKLDPAERGKVAIVIRNVSSADANYAFRVSFSVF